MANEFSGTPYRLARPPKPPIEEPRTRPTGNLTPTDLPPSNRLTLTPGYLLRHKQHFDPGFMTPEEMHENRGDWPVDKKPSIKT